MKTSVLISSLCALAAPAMASLVTFEQPTYPAAGNAINAIDGWSASEPNFFDPTPVTGGSFPLFYTQAGSGGNTFGTIGGVFFAPDSPPYVAQRNFSVQPTLGASTFTFDFNLTDSFNDIDQMFDGTGDRNDFGFSITTASTPLISVDLEPLFQGGATNSTEWRASYTIGGGAKTSTGFAVLPGALTNISVAFNGSGLEFSLGAQDGSGPQPVFSGTPAGYNPATVDDIVAAFSFSEGSSANGFSNNYISLDNIGVVPEPSALMLLGLSVFGLARRRR